MEITVQDLHALRASGEPVTILDVREPDELAICKIDGSIDIPMREIPGNLDKIPRTGALVVICHSGMRSLQVTRWLRPVASEGGQDPPSAAVQTERGSKSPLLDPS